MCGCSHASERELVLVEHVFLVAHAEEDPYRRAGPSRDGARSMLRIGVSPVPVAIINDGDASEAARVKNP